jgi:hypothetical protein
VGDTYDGGYDFEMDGIIDEVRLSDRRLGLEELLIGSSVLGSSVNATAKARDGSKR